MGFHAGHVSDRNQAEEVHSDSRAGWDFMHAMSMIDTEHRKEFMQATDTDSRLTRWMDFMQAMSVIDTEQRKCI
jgi:hypothetical protein